MSASNLDPGKVLAIEDADPLSQEAYRSVLHELHVHQIELELQNEELRRIQAELEASRTRYFTLYDLAPVGYCTLDEQGTLLEVNLTAATLLGVPRSGLVNQPITRFIERSHQDTYYKCRQRLTATAMQQACELQLVTQGDQPLWVHLVISASVDPLGKAMFLANLTDVSSRKKVELELANTAQELSYFRAAIDTHSVVAASDGQGKITYVNRKFCEVSRYPEGELIWEIEQAIRSASCPTELTKDIWRTVGNGQIWKGEVQFTTKAGGLAWLDCNIVPRLNAMGQAVQYIMIGADTTERHHLEEAMRTKNATLAAAIQIADKANAAKSDFLSNMSHELRSPLNAILGFTQLLAESLPPPTPKQLAGIQQILRAGWYLVDLIDEILDLSLIESGKLNVVLGPVSLKDVLRDCHDIVETVAQKKNIALIFPVVDPTWVVNADATRLKQVVINLLSNAIKYNHPGGQVELSCQWMQNGQARIAVRDTGEGLSTSQLAQLFQPFNRLGQQDKGEKGTGIGLVVSKRLVELMAGNIGVSSNLSLGSVFWIELPQALPTDAYDMS